MTYDFHIMNNEAIEINLVMYINQKNDWSNKYMQSQQTELLEKPKVSKSIVQTFECVYLSYGECNSLIMPEIFICNKCDNNQLILNGFNTMLGGFYA